MMGERLEMQEALFYEFSLDRHVPTDHPAIPHPPIAISSALNRGTRESQHIQIAD